MIYVFLANGFEEIEALATVDILRRAELDVYKRQHLVLLYQMFLFSRVSRQIKRCETLCR